MNRAEILDTAKEVITNDRQAAHGSACSAHLNRTIKPHDVAVMMTLLKLARAKANPKHVDNAIDAAGYSALAGEIGAGEG